MKIIRNKWIPFKGFKCINLFGVLYVVEWLCRLFQKGNAYRNISFEREAYDNQYNYNYLSKRKHYSWIKYLRRNRK